MGPGPQPQDMDSTGTIEIGGQGSQFSGGTSRTGEGMPPEGSSLTAQVLPVAHPTYRLTLGSVLAPDGAVFSHTLPPGATVAPQESEPEDSRHSRDRDTPIGTGFRETEGVLAPSRSPSPSRQLWAPPSTTTSQNVPPLQPGTSPTPQQ